MELDDRARKALLDAFDRSDWLELTVTVGAETLHVWRDGQGNVVAGAGTVADRRLAGPEG
jgi:hypothetical protein